MCSQGPSNTLGPWASVLLAHSTIHSWLRTVFMISFRYWSMLPHIFNKFVVCYHSQSAKALERNWTVSVYYNYNYNYCEDVFPILAGINLPIPQFPAELLYVETCFNLCQTILQFLLHRVENSDAYLLEL